MEFLAVIGVIALFFFGKFVYDTYVTNNTDNNWEKYKRNNPDEAARIKGNKGLNFNTNGIINQDKKIASYIFLANNLNCAPEHVETIYITDLRKNISHSSQALEMAKAWRNEKFEQARQLNIDPDDTPASLLETWTISVFDDFERSENLNEENELEDEDEYDEKNIEEEDCEEDIKYESHIINYYNSKGIKVNQSSKDEIIKILGQPDTEPIRAVPLNKISYSKIGLEFLYVHNDGIPIIVDMRISHNFSVYFPEITETIDENITLNSVMNAYGKVYISTCHYGNDRDEFYRIHYKPFFVFESVINKDGGEPGNQRLESISIGGFDGFNIGLVYYTN